MGKNHEVKILKIKNEKFIIKTKLIKDKSYRRKVNAT